MKRASRGTGASVSGIALVVSLGALALAGCNDQALGRLATLLMALLVAVYVVVAAVALVALSVIAIGALSTIVNLVRPSPRSVIVGVIGGVASLLLGVSTLGVAAILFQGESDAQSAMWEVLGTSAAGSLAIVVGLGGVVASYRANARLRAPD